MTTVISVENLSKVYRLGQIGTGTFRDDLRVWWAKLRGRPNPVLKIGEKDHGNRDGEDLWALRDVSFTVDRGEVLGVIGRNGAGKSTLLKILSRVTAPSAGQVNIKGRIASLLEVGTGFHPDLTGRENVYLNGAILGMSRSEVSSKFDEIVEFAEIAQFIDTPVKRYSSGMYVRLAFAVAAHLEPEILLVDEVLAVGDAEFQKKCLGKMGDVAREGRTVLFVSHNMGAVQRLCTSTLWIKNGQIAQLGSTPATIENYFSHDVSGIAEYKARDSQVVIGKRGVSLVRVSVLDSKMRVSESIPSGMPFFVEMEYRIERKIENLRVGFRLINGEGTVIFTSGDTDPDGSGITRQPGTHISRCTIPGNLLNAGRYFITAACDQPMQEIYFLADNIVSFSVELIGGIGTVVPDGRLGIIRPALTWELN